VRVLHLRKFYDKAALQTDFGKLPDCIAKAEQAIQQRLTEGVAVANIPETLERLPTDLELMIFRVVQECLTNVHRHSGSPSVEIGLCNSNEKLTLEIQDHGKGMPADRLIAVTGSGLVGVGLRGMRERVKAFGGELEISSGARGTTVRATIPLRPSLPAADT
jgi:signal transduction histidine kinase